jgi:hypothetical protein
VSLSLLAMIVSNGSSDVVDGVRLSLEESSAYWFSIVKYSGYAVAAGCALEAPETFVIIKRWFLLKFRGEDREETIADKKKWDVPLAAVGLLVIVIGIFLETYAEGKVSNFDALLRAHESDKITAAEGDAASAIRDAGTAKTSANDAAAASTTAKGSASSAMILATGARKEADSFEADIVAAKKQATEANSHLANALQRVVDLTAELNRLKTPRSLKSEGAFVTALKEFKGTEYTFSSVFSDTESINLLIEIDKTLTLAGWKRVAPPHGFPAINIYGKDVDFAVASSLEDGTRVTIESQSSAESLQSSPAFMRPSNVNAGLALNVALSEGITPPQKSADGPVHVDKGDSKVVVIMVGKKQ